MPKLYVITAPPGAGKSTVSAMLAEGMERSVVIEGDWVYHMVVGGYVAPWLPGNHKELFWKNVCSLIRNSLEMGYDVIFNYVVTPKDVTMLQREFSSFTLAVLLPSVEELVRRDNLRPEDCRMGERCRVVHGEFQKHRFPEVCVLRTDGEIPEETVQRVKSLPECPSL